MSSNSSKIVTPKDLSPEIAIRAYKPPRLPEPQAGQQYGHIDIAELKKLAAKAATPTATAGFKPANIKLASVPSTEKWVSELAKQPELLRKAAQGSAMTQKRLQAIIECVIVSDPSLYPWCTVGKIFVGWNLNFSSPVWTGTGVLVGPNTILTASHVAPWDKPGWWMRFVPAYDNGAEPFGSSYVSQFWGYKNTDNVVGDDYVVCHLYNPLGRTVGWMGSQSYGNNNDYKARQWTSVGYPGDSLNGQVPMVQFDVSVDDVDNDQGGEKLETNDLFASPGWSGGPLWGFLGADVASDPRVVGVMSGYERETFLWWTLEQDDVSAGGSPMVGLVIYSEVNWPTP
jgi:hypothetical protein